MNEQRVKDELLFNLLAEGIVRRDFLDWIVDTKGAGRQFFAEMSAAWDDDERTPTEVRDAWFDRYADHMLTLHGAATLASMFNLTHGEEIDA